MSALDQPLLIANSNYHVGHQIAIFVAKEQGFFREENLPPFDYEAGGLIPGPLEAEGLAAAMKNRGAAGRSGRGRRAGLCRFLSKTRSALPAWTPRAKSNGSTIPCSAIATARRTRTCCVPARSTRSHRSRPFPTRSSATAFQ